jgi:pimeloyl-ACP methyl ester carboxylesterase
MKLYLLPGLGADGRMFIPQQPLGLPYDRHRDDRTHKNDTLRTYAHRLCEQVSPSNQDFGLLGVSLGGMLAVEMSKILNPKLTILVSSAKTRRELPPIIRRMRSIGHHHLLTGERLRRLLVRRIYSHDDVPKIYKEVYREMIHDKSITFLQWAVNAIGHWDNLHIPTNRIYHIHGDKDVTLPHRYVSCDVIIPNGSHYMVASRAEDVNRQIKAFIEY